MIAGHERSQVRGRTLAGIAMATLLAAMLIIPASAQSTAPATQTSFPDAPPGARITDLGWFAPPTGVRKPPRPEAVSLAYVIPIREEITPKTFDAIKRKLTSRPSNVDLIIFDLNTPGGRVDVTEQITSLILNDLANVYTVAYVHPDAFSAGAIIAMACDEIVMAPLGRIGAATPILGGPGGIEEMGEDVRAKMHSAIQKIAETVAEQNGYSPLLARSMISREIDIWLIRNRQTKELQIVSPSVFPERIAKLPPAMQTATSPAGSTEQTPWDFVRIIDGPSTVLTLGAPEAYSLGLSSATLRSLEDVQSRYQVQSSQYLGDNWSETLVEFLTGPIITGILMFALIIGIYALTHTGSITSIIVVLVSLGLLLGARYLTGMALWWEIVVLIVGIILILAEVFVIPGFGVTGIIGILMVLAGFLLMIVPNLPDMPPIPVGDLGWGTFSRALLALCLAFIAATIVGYLLVKNMPRLPFARRLTLKPAAPAGGPPVVEVDVYESVMPGCVGQAETTCRPVGKVRIGRDLFDAICEGEMVRRGDNVRVLRREGSTLIVELNRETE